MGNSAGRNIRAYLEPQMGTMRAEMTSMEGGVRGSSPRNQPPPEDYWRGVGSDDSTAAQVPKWRTASEKEEDGAPCIFGNSHDQNWGIWVGHDRRW